MKNTKNAFRCWRIGLAFICLLSVALTAVGHAESNAPFIADALDKAQQQPTTEGKWVVTAAVAISSESKPKMTASGPVTAVSDDELAGTLPMQIEGGSGADNALAFNIKRNGYVTIQWLIAGKPYLGRPAFTYDGIPVGDSLSRKINWNGAARAVKVTLESKWVKNSPPPIRRPGERKPSPPPIRKKGEPIGKRYQITGFIFVTDSDDGVLDDTIEITGVAVYYQHANGGGQKAQLPEQPLVKLSGQKMRLGDKLYFNSNIFVDHIFSDPKTEYLTVRGSIYDADMGTLNDDLMLSGQTRGRSLAWLAANGQQTLKGDEDSESCDIIFRVKEVGDIY